MTAVFVSMRVHMFLYSAKSLIVVKMDFSVAEKGAHYITAYYYIPTPGFKRGNLVYSSGLPPEREGFLIILCAHSTPLREEICYRPPSDLRTML